MNCAEQLGSIDKKAIYSQTNCTATIQCNLRLHTQRHTHTHSLPFRALRGLYKDKHTHTHTRLRTFLDIHSSPLYPHFEKMSSRF